MVEASRNTPRVGPKAVNIPPASSHRASGYFKARDVDVSNLASEEKSWKGIEVNCFKANNSRIAKYAWKQHMSAVSKTV